MNTIPDVFNDGRRRRRKHSAEFKAQLIAACRTPGVSIAAVAMAHGINANLARRWIQAAELGDESRSESIRRALAQPSFVPLRLPPPESASPADIRIELHRGPTTINVTWPSTAAAECAALLRELLR